MKAHKLQVKKVELADVKLDFGCGPNPAEGFEGVDSIAFPNVKHKVDLRSGTYPWANNSITEARAFHFIEHLTSKERCHFVNELWRILKVGAKLQFAVPHWNSNRAYGDPTHVWPPVSEMWFYYLSRQWRAEQAPHTDIKVNPDGLACNFEAVWGYNIRQDLQVMNPERQQFAIANYKEVLLDTIGTLTKAE